MREQDLDDLFAQARALALPDTGPLLARVLADAAHYQSVPTPYGPPHIGVDGPGLWAKLAAALGGKGVLAGIGTAAVAGVMLGFAQPASITAVTESLFAQTPIGDLDLLPGIDAILTEG